MRSRSLSLIMLAGAASCGFPPPSPLTDAGSGSPGDGSPGDGPSGPPGIDLKFVAGSIGGPGAVDGVGAGARFNRPQGVAIDSAGNLYIADTDNNTIRKVTPTGMVTTLAGSAGSAGSANGTGAAARFSGPIGIAVDGSGNLYIADGGNQTIRKVTPAGVVTTLAGFAGAAGSTDGVGAAARFNAPIGLALDAAGNVYVADRINDTIRKITPAGSVSTFAGAAGSAGSTDATGAAARFTNPSGVAVDNVGNVYVGDTGNETIRKITPAGLVTTLAGSPGQGAIVDGTGAAARFSFPDGVTIDASGNIYVADGGAEVRKVTATGVVTTLAGGGVGGGIVGSVDGTGVAARFSAPQDVVADTVGNIYVADTNNSTIRKITSAGVTTTFAGAVQVVGNADGTGAAAGFDRPVGVAVDSTGTAYVADLANCTIRKVTASGVVTTFAGSNAACGGLDGAGSAATFTNPAGVALDGAGNVYVADTFDDTIRTITPAGVVSTLAGSARMLGSIDATGPAARFAFPFDLAVDNAGNVYVADAGNGTIRKVTPVGVVTTLAGMAGTPGSDDGTGSAARFNMPEGIAVDGSGNVYVADTGNDTIRKVTPAGAVTTLASSAGSVGSADGTGPAARFNAPQGLKLDASGNLLVADTGNATIRKITPAGVVTTVAGKPGVIGIVLGATPGFSQPQSLAVLGDSLVIVDSTAVLLLEHSVK